MWLGLTGFDSLLTEAILRAAPSPPASTSDDSQQATTARRIRIRSGAPSSISARTIMSRRAVNPGPAGGVGNRHAQEERCTTGCRGVSAKRAKRAKRAKILPRQRAASNIPPESGSRASRRGRKGRQGKGIEGDAVAIQTVAGFRDQTQATFTLRPLRPWCEQKRRFQVQTSGRKKRARAPNALAWANPAPLHPYRVPPKLARSWNRGQPGEPHPEDPKTRRTRSGGPED